MTEFGLGYLPPPSTPAPSVTLPPGVEHMVGSVLIFRAANLDAAWERIKDDIYWTSGVWDKEKSTVHQLIKHPNYNDE